MKCYLDLWRRGVFLAFGCGAAFIFYCLTVPAYANDVTTSSQITRGPLVFNRSTETFDSNIIVKNTGQFSFVAPFHLMVIIDSPRVTLSNKTGSTAAGVPFIDTVLSNGTLNQGQSILIPLKFSNPTRTTFTVDFIVDANTDQVTGLPPDPGEAGKVTVAGIDSNNNGVRDDVEIYIAQAFPDSARHRAALMQVAVTMQKYLLVTTRPEAVALGNEALHNIDCLSYLGFLQKDTWKLIQVHMLNTPARLRALESFNDLANGSVFTDLPDSQARSACRFDVEHLPN